MPEGRPLFVRSPDSTFDLATFMRAQLYTSLATLGIGMDVLHREEGVKLAGMFAHGGLFKTKGVAQRSTTVDTLLPSPADVAGFAAYIRRFAAGLPLEAAAGGHTH